MRKLIKKSVAAALSTALLVTLGPVADISTVKAADDYTYLLPDLLGISIGLQRIFICRVTRL